MQNLRPDNTGRAWNLSATVAAAFACVCLAYVLTDAAHKFFDLYRDLGVPANQAGVAANCAELFKSWNVFDLGIALACVPVLTWVLMNRNRTAAATINFAIAAICGCVATLEYWSLWQPVRSVIHSLQSGAAGH